MKYRFLCGPHRQRLSHDANKALYAFQNSFETAQTLTDLEQYKDAIPFIGSAFEIAEIILTSKPTKAQRCCEMFSGAAVLFAKTLMEMGHEEQAHEVYLMTIDRLERELSLGYSNQAWLNNHLAFFYQSSQMSDFGGGEKELFATCSGTGFHDRLVH